MPALTSWGGYTMFLGGGGGCGGGTINTNVYTSDGQDHVWSYVVVGAGAGGAALRNEAAPLPKN